MGGKVDITVEPVNKKYAKYLALAGFLEKLDVIKMGWNKHSITFGAHSVGVKPKPHWIQLAITGLVLEYIEPVVFKVRNK